MFRTTAGGGRGPGRRPRRGRAPGRHRPAPRIARSRDDRKKQDSPERAIGRPILLVTNAPVKEQRGGFLSDELGPDTLSGRAAGRFSGTGHVCWPEAPRDEVCSR